MGKLCVVIGRVDPCMDEAGIPAARQGQGLIRVHYFVYHDCSLGGRGCLSLVHQALVISYIPLYTNPYKQHGKQVKKVSALTVHLTSSDMQSHFREGRTSIPSPSRCHRSPILLYSSGSLDTSLTHPHTPLSPFHPPLTMSGRPAPKALNSSPQNPLAYFWRDQVINPEHRADNIKWVHLAVFDETSS